MQSLAARRLRHADRGFHAARRAGLPRQNRERREGHGQQGRRRPRPRRPHDETRDAFDDGFHESTQSGLASSAGRIVVHDDTDDGNGSNPEHHDDRTDHADRSGDDRGNDARGNSENNRNPGPVGFLAIELVVFGIEHGGLGGIVSLR